MPKATINKNSKSLLLKGKIWFSRNGSIKLYAGRMNYARESITIHKHNRILPDFVRFDDGSLGVVAGCDNDATRESF